MTNYSELLIKSQAISDDLKKISKGTWVFAVCFIALVLRLVYLYQNIDNPFYYLPILDEKFYLEQGQFLANTSWAGNAYTFYMDPLLSYYLGGVFSIVSDVFFARITMILMDVLNVYLIFILSTKLFSLRVAVLASFVYACYPPAIFYSPLLLKVIPVTTGLLVYALSLYRCTDKGSKFTWFGLGVFCGLVVLLRSNLILLIVLTPMAILLNVQNRKLLLESTVACVLGSLLGLVIVGGLHAKAAGEFRITGVNGGFVAYIANNPDNTSGTHSSPAFVKSNDPLASVGFFIREAEKRTGNSMDMAEASDFWKKEAFRFMRENPDRVLMLWGKRFAQFISNGEFGSNYFFDNARENSTVLSISFLGFALILSLSLLGGFVGTYDKKRLSILLIPVLLSLATCVLFFAFSRLRFPAVPFIIILASYAAFNLSKLNLQTTRHIVAVGTSLLVFIMSFSVRVPEDIRIESKYNLGVAHIKMGQLDQAELLALQLLTQRPDYGKLHHLFGVVQQKKENSDLAIVAFGRAIEHGFQNREVFHNLGVSYVEAGVLDKAINSFMKSTSVEAHPETLFLLSETFHSAGDVTNAKHYLRLLSQDPQFDPEVREEASRRLRILSPLEESGPESAP